MELREHPLMSYRGVSNWPPVWVPLSDLEGQRLNGEVGTLTEVRMTKELPKSCFLVVNHNEKRYLGCLLFNDQSFCDQIFVLLQNYYGYPIDSIARLDISHTL